jgi:hypothetical protein
MRHIIPNKIGTKRDLMKVIVKFVARNGEKVPELLARNVAPTLRYCRRPTALVYFPDPLTMSTTEGMWAPDMEPVAQIRPRHDRMSG